MRRFVIKVVVLVALLIILDRVFFYCLQTQRPIDYKLFLESKMDFFKCENNFDLLVIGDSHIADALDTRILDSCFKVNSYNLGVYHASPFESYYMTKAALNHLQKKPKIVILGTNPVMFERKVIKGIYTPLILGPNCGLIFNSEDGVDLSIFFKTLREKYLLKHTYNNLVGKRYNPTREIVSVYNGHLEFYNQMENVKWESYEKEPELYVHEKEQIDYFIKTIELLLSHNIEVIIVNTPIWHQQLMSISSTKSFLRFEKDINRIAKDYELEIYNSKHDELISELEKNDFLNAQHLNAYGSKKFTLSFCSRFNSSK